MFELLQALGQNRYFWGLAMVTMNIGSRFVLGDISQLQERFFMNMVVKKLVMFCMFFIATRDVMTSIILVFFFSVTIFGIFNEKNKFSVVPPMNVDGPKVTTAEYLQAKKIIDHYENVHFPERRSTQRMDAYRANTERFQVADS